MKSEYENVELQEELSEEKSEDQKRKEAFALEKEKLREQTAAFTNAR